MNNLQIFRDAQAIRLLCIRLRNDKQNDVKPLSVKEYGDLASWLSFVGSRPADLLKRDEIEKEFNKNLPPFDKTRIQKLLSRGVALSEQLETWRRQGVWIITRAESDYPQNLRKKLRNAAPPVIFGMGDINLLKNKSAAVVGSRNADHNILSITQKVALHLVKHDIQIISGGAKGIDAAAMESALQFNGSAVGFLSGDLLRRGCSGKLRKHIQEKRLLLLSAVNPEAGFNAGNAMARNKYIYALADAGIIVRSDVKGGTWQGAREQLMKYRNNRIFVFNLDKSTAPGNAKLIIIGAHPLDPEMLEDVHIRIFSIKKTKMALSPKQYDFLTDASIDAITAREDENSEYP